MGDNEWELPAPEDAVGGASTVLFPWSAAQTALDRLDEMVSTLEGQLERRGEMQDEISDWEGPFHDDFVTTEGEHVSKANELKAALQNMALDILDHANAAIGEQETRNETALNEGGDDE